MARVEVSGWASTPQMDHARHVVAPGAFDASIREKGLSGPQGIKFLFAHRDTFPLGAITKLETRNGGLWLEAFIETDISWGKDVAVASKAAGGLSYSVGFYLLDADIEESADGREYLLILKAELTEVSVVVFPCNPHAVMVTEEKAHGGDPLVALEAVLAKVKMMNATTKTTNPSAAADRFAAKLDEMKRIFR